MADLRAFEPWLRKRLEIEPELSRFFDGAYALRVEGEQWTFTVRPKIVAMSGVQPAETAIRVPAEDLLAIVNGISSAADAVKQNRLAWFGHKPEIELTLRLFTKAEQRVESVKDYLERRLVEVAQERGFFDLLPNGLRLEIGGAGTWTIGAVPSLSSGGGEPFAAELEMSRADFDALIAGTLDGAAAFSEGRIVVTGERADGPWIALQPRMARGVIEGTVEPVDVMAAVTAMSEGGPIGPVMVSGWFRLALPPGVYEFTVEAAQMQSPDPVRLDLADGKTVKVAMKLQGTRS